MTVHLLLFSASVSLGLKTKHELISGRFDEYRLRRDENSTLSAIHCERFLRHLEVLKSSSYAGQRGPYVERTH